MTKTTTTQDVPPPDTQVFFFDTKLGEWVAGAFNHREQMWEAAIGHHRAPREQVSRWMPQPA